MQKDSSSWSNQLRFAFTFLLAFFVIETIFHFFGPKPQLQEIASKSAAHKEEVFTAQQQEALEQELMPYALSWEAARSLSHEPSPPSLEPVSGRDAVPNALNGWKIDEKLFLLANPAQDPIDFAKESPVTVSRSKNALQGSAQEEPEKLSLKLLSSPRAPLLLLGETETNLKPLSRWLAHCEDPLKQLEGESVALSFLSVKEDVASQQVFVVPVAAGALVLKPEQEEQLKESLTSSGAIIWKAHEELSLRGEKRQRWIPVALYHFGAPSLQEPLVEELPQVLALPTKLLQEARKLYARESETAKAREQSARYVVMESETLQLLVDTHLGVIREINLPFASSATSAIRPVEIDKLLEDTPHGSYPLKQGTHKGQAALYQFSPSKEGALADRLERIEPKVGGYYPLLRRERQEGEAAYLFGSLFDEEGRSVETAPYTIACDHSSQGKLTLTAEQGARRITKRIVLSNTLAPHTFMFEIEIEGDRTGLWMQGGVLEAEANSSGITEEIKYLQAAAQEGRQESLASLSLPKGRVDHDQVQANWVLHSNGFFGTVIDPLEEHFSKLRLDFVSGETLPSRYNLDLLPEKKRFPAKKQTGAALQLPLSLKPKQTLRIFAGPVSHRLLAKVDQHLASALPTDAPEEMRASLETHYEGSTAFVGWFSWILKPFVRAMMLVLDQLHQWTQSWALSIILITVILRGLLFPLTSWSTKNMQRQQELQPQITQLRARYKKDPQTLQTKEFELYKKAGITPISGCLPLLIQLPFLFAMLNLMRHAVDLRGVRVIEGWIDDLAAPDVVGHLPFSLPFLGDEIHLLPIVLGLLTYLQSKWMRPATGASPQKKKGKEASSKEKKEQEAQQETIARVSSVLFTFFFYQLPSGLNLYWLSSTLLGLVERKYILAPPSPARTPPTSSSPTSPPPTHKSSSSATALAVSRAPRKNETGEESRRKGRKEKRAEKEREKENDSEK